MSDLSSEIAFHKAEDKAQGLSFGIVNLNQNSSLIDELLTPSLRNFHVIFWFKKGKGKYFIDFEEYDFEPNTIVLISKNQINYLAPEEDDWEVQSITFTTEFLYRNDNDLRNLFSFNMTTHVEGVQVIHPNDEAKLLLENTSNQLFDIFKWESELKGSSFYHLVSLFLLYLEKDRPEHNGNCEEVDENTKLALAFDQLLEENYKQEFSVSFYADSLTLTSKTLSRLTNKHHKRSPKAVIDERRILEIKRLLKGTTQSLKEIAYLFSFDEPTNMVKYFKKHTDSTPNNFRHDL